MFMCIWHTVKRSGTNGSFLKLTPIKSTSNWIDIVGS